MVRGMSWPRQTSDTQSRFLPHATHASEPGSVARKPWGQYVPSFASAKAHCHCRYKHRTRPQAAVVERKTCPAHACQSGVSQAQVQGSGARVTQPVTLPRSRGSSPAVSDRGTVSHISCSQQKHLCATCVPEAPTLLHAGLARTTESGLWPGCMLLELCPGRWFCDAAELKQYLSLP